MTKRKCSFTLLEILFVLFLLALLGGLVGFNGASFFKEMKKTANQTALKEELHYIKALSLLEERPIEVHCREDSKGVMLHFVVDPFSPYLKKVLKDRHLDLKKEEETWIYDSGFCLQNSSC